MSASDKTEKATPKRRKEARKQGQVARSVELNGAAVLIAGLLGVSVFGRAAVNGVASMMRVSWSRIGHPGNVSSAAGLHDLFSLGMHTMLTAVAPVLGICLFAALLANIAQLGVRPSLAALKPDVKRINPISGAKNLFGPRMVFEIGKTLAKVAVVGGVAATALIPMLSSNTTVIGTTPGALGGLLGSGARAIIFRVLLAYGLIAIVDFAWQRRQHTKRLKMTRQEVREEFRQMQLPPEVRAALRRRQMQASKARMMAAVPTADVIITNPTHYAVALRYDGSKPAPTVVAKGKNLIAAQIRRIAGENGVPIVPDPPLARSLHASVEIDHMIPAELYAAVAQVLAYVYRMANRRRVAA